MSLSVTTMAARAKELEAHLMPAPKIAVWGKGHVREVSDQAFAGVSRGVSMLEHSVRQVR